MAKYSFLNAIHNIFDAKSLSRFDGDFDLRKIPVSRWMDVSPNTSYHDEQAVFSLKEFKTFVEAGDAASAWLDGLDPDTRLIVVSNNTWESGL